MEKQMLKWLPINRDAKLITLRIIALTLSSWLQYLLKENIFAGTA